MQIAPISHLDLIRRAYRDAQATAHTAVQQALFCGQLLAEEKARVDHGDFLAWLKANAPEIPERTARRWMAIADKAIQFALAADPNLAALVQPDGCLLIGSYRLPISRILSTQDFNTLPVAAREHAEALAFSIHKFTSDRTMRECLEAVVVEGDDTSRVDRAANGKLLGGHCGEDRRNYPEFIQRSFGTVTAHLSHWEAMSPVQRERAAEAFSTSATKWPTPFLETILATAKKELSRR